MSNRRGIGKVLDSMTPAQLHQIVAEAGKALEGNQPWVAVELYTQILAQTDPKTEKLETQDLRLVALYERGRVLREIGEMEAALAAFEQYLHEAQDKRHQSRALESIGSIYRNMGRYQDAREKYEESLKLAEAIMYPYGRAKALEGLGTYHHLLGHEEEAENYFQMSYSLFKSSGNLIGQITTLTSIAIMQSYNAIDKAISTHEEALGLARNVGQPIYVVALLNNLGECYQDLFAMEEALTIHQEALSLCKQAQTRHLEGDIERNIGVELTYLQQYERATHHLRRALQLSRELNDLDVEAQSLYSMALVEVNQQQVEEAERHTLQLQKLADQTNSERYWARARYALGLVRQKQGDGVAAAEQWQQALFLAHRTNQRMLLWQIHASLAEISAIPGLGAVHLRIAAEIILQIAQPIQDETLRNRFIAAAPVAHVLRQAR